MNSAKLVRFSKLVSDSSDSEGVFSLLGRTVVDECGAFHALVFGTSPDGDFTVLSSYGGCERQLSQLDLTGVGSLAELGSTVMAFCSESHYGFRTFPLISEAGLFGALGVVYSQTHHVLDEAEWTLIEGMTELTAISLNKTFQHQKLQKAFDDLRLSQDAHLRSEKLRALGQMSAGIAHDLRNLLSPMLLYTDHIRDVAADEKEVLGVAAKMDRILTRGMETVERLRDFSRQTPEESEAIATDLNEMVREAVEISKPRLSGIDLALLLGTPVVAVIRRSDCVTAIVNLLFNALDALEGSGKIAVSTGVTDGWSWIEVQDNGPGIPQDVKNKILEPFFTTKGQFGTGLGVPIVYAFTQRHGGRLEIESEPGQGARFKMLFPESKR